MSGMKGRSGGPRANSGGARPNSGGARPGAGRPKKVVDLDLPEYKDPQEFLLAVMNNKKIDAKLRVAAAKALMPYIRRRIGERGNSKEILKDVARSAHAGTNWDGLLQ